MSGGPRFISESLIEKHVTPADMVAAVEAAQRALGLGQAWSAPRQRVRVPAGVLHMMGAAWPEEGLVGYKTYTSFREGTRFHVYVFDIKTGAPRVVAEAARLGQLRTGAATAVAVKHLANPAPRDGSVVALLGSGFQAWGQVECVASVRPIRELRVFSRTAANAEALAHRTREVLKIDSLVSSSAEKAVTDADIIITATTSAEPVLEERWIASGATVCGVGANGLVRREMDVRTVSRASLIVVDQVEQARLECGALLAASEANRFHWEQARELGAVVAGQTPGRQRTEDVVLFLSHGLALWDIASVVAALRKLDQHSLPLAFPAV